MENDDYGAWDGDKPDTGPDNGKQQEMAEMQKLIEALQKKAANAVRYLVLEGFITPTDQPNHYEYTPEGLVLAQLEYKKLQSAGQQ